MEKSSDMTSWITCARVAVAKRRSQLTEPEKWTFVDDKMTPNSWEKIVRTPADFQYLSVKYLDFGTLPESFEPLFETQTFWQPNGYIKGKYMSVQRDIIDATNFNWFEEMPLKTPKADCWHNYVEAGEDGRLRSPVVQGLIYLGAKGYALVQETPRWLLFMKESEDKSLLVFRFREKLVSGGLVKQSDNIFELTLSQSPPVNKCLVQFLPNQQGAFLLQQSHYQVEDARSDLFYIDLSHLTEDTGPKLVATFPAGITNYRMNSSVRFLRRRHIDLTTPRDFLLFYEGTLWLNYRECGLIPLWIDLSGDLCGYIKNLKPLQLLPRQYEPNIQFGDTYRLYHSADKRWVTHVDSYARIVCDLKTGKTYIVRDRGWRMRVGATFVGLDDTKETPQFYGYTQRFLANLNHLWETPTERGSVFIAVETDDEDEPYSMDYLFQCIEELEADEDEWGRILQSVLERSVRIIDQSEDKEW